jgi:copper chaperone
MKSEYRKGVTEKPLAADCCSGHSRQEVRPTSGALDEHFLGHTRAAFTVQGMTCGGCAKSIKDALTKQPGVSNASVDFETRQATIDFDPEWIDSQAIEAAVSAAG